MSCTKQTISFDSSCQLFIASVKQSVIYSFICMLSAFGICIVAHHVTVTRCTPKDVDYLDGWRVLPRAAPCRGIGCRVSRAVQGTNLLAAINRCSYTKIETKYTKPHHEHARARTHRRQNKKYINNNNNNKQTNKNSNQ